MMSKSPISRLLALLLAAAMTMSLLPASVLAEEWEEPSLPVQTEEMEEEPVEESTQEVMFQEVMLEEALPDEEPVLEEPVQEPIEEPSTEEPNAEEPSTEESVNEEPVVDPTEDTFEQESLQEEVLPAEKDTSIEVQQAEQTAEPEEKPKRETRWMTAKNASDVAGFLRKNWSGRHFRKAVVDPRRNRVTVDGQTASVSEAFGAEAEEADILESSEAAEEYFSESVFEAETNQSGTLTVTSPYQSCRIILSATQLSEGYGAETVVKNDPVGEYILQFSNEEDTRAAYEEMKQTYGEQCFVDEILWADDLLCAVEHDGVTYPNTSSAGTTYSWGSACTGTMGRKQSGQYAKKSATVAILDTGIDPNNWFFSGRTISSKSKDMVTGKTGKANLKDYAGNTSSTGHGTHVAGILADCTPSSVELLVLRIFDNEGKSSWSLVSSAIDYAVEKKADIINMSFGDAMGTSRFDMPLEKHLSAAREAGIPVVCAAGNDAENVANNYPASSPLTIAVSSIEPDHRFSSAFSNYGKAVDFCAPGGEITSALRGASSGETTEKSGTSMAAPHVTAAMTYLIMDNPSADVQSLYSLLAEHCVDLGDPGKDSYYGWGYPSLLGSTHAHKWKETPKVSGKNYVYACASCSETLTVSAYCGAKVQWALKDNTLTLSGSGAMNDYNSGEVPWKPFTDRIKTVTVKKGVTSIGANAFEALSSLKTLKLPLQADGGTLQSIGAFAFFGCTAMGNPTIPATVTTIGEAAFASCDAITKFKVESGSKKFKASSLGFLWSKDGKSTLYACPTRYSINSTNFTYFVDAKTIAPYAFYRCKYLSKIIFGGNVQTVGEQSCANCSNLKIVYFAGNRPDIASDAFAGVRTSLAAFPMGADRWLEGNNQYGGSLNWRSYIPNLKDCDLVMGEEYPHTGSPVKPFFVLTSNGISLTSTDYSAKYEKNTNVGTAIVTFTGKNAYSGTLTKTFEITPVPVGDLSISLSSASVAYTGKAIKPTVTVKNGSVKLVSGTDYTLSYQNHTAVGTATVTIKGKGNYCGSTTKTFAIVPKTTSVSSASSKKTKQLTVAWKKNTSASGYQVQVATDKAFTKNLNKQTIAKNSTVGCTFTGLKKGKTYYVRIRAQKTVDGKTYASPWKTHSKAVKIK